MPLYEGTKESAVKKHEDNFKVESEKDYLTFLEDIKKHIPKIYTSKQDKYKCKLSDFEPYFKLGSGAFGRVLLVQYKKTGEYFAMKILKKGHLVKSKQIDHTLNEKRILQNCKHPFLMNMVFYTSDNSNIYFVLPYFECGDLYGSLVRLRKFTETAVRFYAAQVFLGIEYLHCLDIIYRDLKPENIMIDGMGYIKLTDFGFCKIVKGRTYTICGTPEYLAPELVLMKGYGLTPDWWSFGILLFELSAGYVPFKDSGDHVRLYNTIVSGKYRMCNNFSKDLKDLITQLLQVDTTKRIGCLKKGPREIKDHPWFGDFPWLHLINRKIIAPVKPPIDNPQDMIQKHDTPFERFSLESVNNTYEAEFEDF